MISAGEIIKLVVKTCFKNFVKSCASSISALFHKTSKKKWSYHLFSRYDWHVFAIQGGHLHILRPTLASKYVNIHYLDRSNITAGPQRLANDLLCSRKTSHAKLSIKYTGVQAPDVTRIWRLTESLQDNMPLHEHYFHWGWKEQVPFTVRNPISPPQLPKSRWKKLSVDKNVHTALNHCLCQHIGHRGHFFLQIQVAPTLWLGKIV